MSEPRRDPDSEAPRRRRRRSRRGSNPGLPEYFEYPGIFMVFLLLLGGLAANGYSADGLARATAFVGCAAFGTWGLVCWAIRGRRYTSQPPGIWVAALLGFLALIAFVQTIPLPASFAMANSPAWKQAVEALKAVGGAVPDKLPLSTAPERTAQAFHQLVASLAFFIGALAMASARRTATWLAGAVALLAVVEAFLGFSLFVLGGMSRASGGVLNPSHHSACVLMGLPVSIALVLLWKADQKDDPFSPQSNRDFFMFLVAALMLMGCAWLLGFSRASVIIGAFLLTGFVLHEMLLHYKTMHERWGKVRFPGLEIGLVLVAGIVLLAATPIAGHMFQRFQSTTQFTGGRTQMWKATVKAFWESPIFGIGFGGTEFALNRLLDTMATRRAPIWSHNDFLQIGAETGLVGILGATVLLAGLATTLLQSVRAGAIPLGDWKRGMIARGALVGAASVLLHSTMEFPLRVPMLGFQCLALVALAVGRRGRGGSPHAVGEAAEDDD